MSHTDVLRAGYDAYNRRDFAGASHAFAEDIVWRIPDPARATISGRAAVLGFWNDLAGQFVSHTISLDDAVETQDRVVAFITHTFTRADGVSGAVVAVHDWQLRDGWLVSMREVADTLAFAVVAGLVPQRSEG
jgi:ketosteroid isomerase-like protein